MSRYSFSKIANVKFNRSKFDLSQQHKTTINVGDLCPVYLQEVYPGDSFKIKTAFVARASVPYLKVPMDNLFMDMYYFFVPNRLVFDKWSQIFGENKSSAWVPASETVAPKCVIDLAKCEPGTVANYMGIPFSDDQSDELKVTDIPFRAFALIWNEWFRDENVQAPVYINISSTSDASNNDNVWSSSNFHGKVPKVNKVHDYFTSCLPGTQKGSATNVPLISGAQAPVKTSPTATVTVGTSTPALQYRATGSGTLLAGYATGLGTVSSGNARAVASTSQTIGANNIAIAPNNLYADLSNIGAVNINDLRFAFQLQKMLELDARGGTRYTEYLLNHFGTVNPDARLQRPEFLGGKRQPLVMQQVNQTTPGAAGGTPQASVAAYSLSGGVNGCSKSFTEHGFVIGVAAIRYYHTYQQGIERFWSRSKRTDFYDPLFAHLGEQPVYRKELFVRGGTGDDNVFGYQEPWADLRFRKNLVSGALATDVAAGLDVWHFADYYGSAPVLSDSFIEENGAPVDRALSAGSDTIPNFILDFYFNVDAIRVLPTYGTPGRIDHNM